MFTGIVEEMGIIRGIRKNRESAVVSVKAEKVLEDLKVGDSVSEDRGQRGGERGLSYCGRIFPRRIWSGCDA